jgi:hypothetical protein
MVQESEITITPSVRSLRDPYADIRRCAVSTHDQVVIAVIRHFRCLSGVRLPGRVKKRDNND